MSTIFRIKNIPLNSVYIEDKAGSLTDIFRSLKFAVQEKSLNPMVGIGRKKDIGGRDEKVLNIFLGEKTGENENKIKDNSTLRKKVILAVFLLVFLGGIAAVYFINKSRQKAVKIIPSNREKQEDQVGLLWEK